METKSFILSKLNWVGIITVVIGTLGLLQQLELSEEVMKIIMVVTGFLTIVLRTFFTSTTISPATPPVE